ncbi:hypothetical protein M426DRAFT_13948 [Hypoxylon sp. CI-4A]|nr:hypothetical protein M426DRAFT_13948 [Hypoxylon sp. CI-4A]
MDQARYKRLIQLQALEFEEYRRQGNSPNWRGTKVEERRSRWEQVNLPDYTRPNLFWYPKWMLKWVPQHFKRAGPVMKVDAYLNHPARRADPDITKTRHRLRQMKYMFISPYVKYQKALGYGGMGIAAQFKYNRAGRDPRDFVVKASLKGWKNDDLLIEEKTTKKFQGAQHCIQLLENSELGLQVKRPPRLTAPDYEDSSDESWDSGDADVPDDRRRPHRIRRVYWTPEQKIERENKRRARLARYNANRALKHEEKEFLLLEYCEGGSLENLIRRIQNQVPEHVVQIPNRVLWQLWFCLVRAVVALRYPPRKFHPDRPIPYNPEERGNLMAEAPPHHSKRWRSKNHVHFDIDPWNIFIGRIEPSTEEDYIEVLPPTSRNFNLPGFREYSFVKRSSEKPAMRSRENFFIRALRRLKMSTSRKPDVIRLYKDRETHEHELVPSLKLADFGLTKDVKFYKRNVYYAAKRGIGKAGFYSPEQFGGDWNHIPPERDGPQAGEHMIAGNYGSHTNVWHIALTLWMLMTQLDTPLPPQPQLPPDFEVTEQDDAFGDPGPTGVSISYAPLITGPNSIYSRIDEELRNTVFQCMYHRPADRPKIEALYDQAAKGIKKRFDGETDAFIKEWVGTFFFDAPDGGMDFAKIPVIDTIENVIKRGTPEDKEVPSASKATGAKEPPAGPAASPNVAPPGPAK